MNAINACSGFLPVANAFGAVSCTIATLGIGRPLAIITSWINPNNFGFSDSSITRAPVIRTTNESEA